MNYRPIENYAIVGDLNTVALVGLNGSIDFLGFPDFDSPSILDKDKGGYFKICPKQEDVNGKQMYLPDTNVLLTHFLSPGAWEKLWTLCRERSFTLKTRSCAG